MFRNNTCGELRLTDIGQEVQLCGWIQVIRDLGSGIFIDLRDRFGLVQLSFFDTDDDLVKEARKLGREYVIQVIGLVILRSNKNPELPTGEIEVKVHSLKTLNKSFTPPFLIASNTDGGDELRMKYRYLDLRRSPMQDNLIFRHKLALEIRNYLSGIDFLEIETPFLIKSTPEGAKDFVVPSRLYPLSFYALPQSPQIFKQLLMIAGYDKYFQITKCFRDEDLRSDRQLEFTQIDCEMSFVHIDDIYATFEGMMRHLFKALIAVDLGHIPKISYEQAMSRYGTDKPDLRFDIPIFDITNLAQGKDFPLFDTSQKVVAISVPGMSGYSRKKIDALTHWLKSEVGNEGLVWVKIDTFKEVKSSVDKFFTKEDLELWQKKLDAKPGDMILILSGQEKSVLIQMGLLRNYVAELMGLIDDKKFAALWVTDFPLLEWEPDEQRYKSTHHPFTSPREQDVNNLDTDPSSVLSKAYDFVINGQEIGGGSLRIHNPDIQCKILKILGLSDNQIQEKFGFLIEALSYGAPPHGGIALGLDRMAAVMKGGASIRDYIAFPKNNAARDVMMDSPSLITDEQLKELSLQ